jgi:spore coat polysaccharide biosynthesis protein SpsF
MNSLTTKKVVGVITARMTSTRLAGKVMAPILGKPMLELLVERVKRSKLLDQIVVATTENKIDDCVFETAKRLGVGFFRGSEPDVLGRIIKAGEKYGAEIVVRLTGDNPLVDPYYIDKGIKIFLSGKYDYVANDNIKLTMERGFDVEIVTL